MKTLKKPPIRTGGNELFKLRAFDLLGGIEGNVFQTAVDDPSDALEPTSYQTPEQRMLDMLMSLAVREAEQRISKKAQPRERREQQRRKTEAREWLSEGTAEAGLQVVGRAGVAKLLRARACCEQLSIDYDAAMKILEKRWRKAK